MPLGSLKQSSLVSKVEPSTMHQDRSLKMSNDNVLVSHILGTHNPHGQEVYAKPLLGLVAKILSLGPHCDLSPDTPIITDAPLLEKLQTAKKDATLLETLLYTIDQTTNKDVPLLEKLEIAKKDAALLETQLSTINQITNKEAALLETLLYTIDQTANKDVALLERLLNTIDQTAKKDAPLLKTLLYMIDQISNELAYMASSGTKEHITTVTIFNMLANYKWGDKLVLTLFAFAWNYGQFDAQTEHGAPLKPKLNILKDLIGTALEVTHCVIEFNELPSKYITMEVPALSSAMDQIPSAAYWTVRSIVGCTYQIVSFTSKRYEFALSTTEAWEPSTRALKLKTILEDLRKKMKECIQYIEKMRDIESYQMLVDLFKINQIDNMKALKALICPRDDVQVLVDGNTKKRVNLDVLRKKNVLLLISSLHISEDELMILNLIYNESRVLEMRSQSPYEIVWIPIVDQLTDVRQRYFELLRAQMTWYSVYHPSIISTASVKIIREEWHFKDKPILVVLDHQGRVVSPNAIHMMWIWGSHAFPFTTLREEDLWREEAWRLELLVDGIDATILNWIKERKYIFVYGGDDMEWIRKFTKEAKAVAATARIPLEMVYVGKATKKEQVKRVIANIVQEKLSYCWQDPAMIWFFWMRLESMLFSKFQLGKDEEHDLMMQQIKRVLSFDREGTWAVLSRGSSVLVNEHGNILWSALFEHDQWKENVPLQGFDAAFQTYVATLRGNSHPCCRFEFSHNAGKNPESMKCPECHHYMEKYTTFLCCHDEGIVPSLLALSTTNT
ncbi:protein SIEVE ELEMENT OCCLUSION B-like [Quercus lobata]|uniref:protein SIEVE ELEMENT OCCLUSION B-like n=1 Tax=Quercus lobata TaxID=97700 RepID=UPI001244CD92|nr:protein SIEVE ELEMENT OCCLUSION B-like [Quercus lobata]